MPRLDYKKIAINALPLALFLGGVAWGLTACGGTAEAGIGRKAKRPEAGRLDPFHGFVINSNK